jgi:hypothetical protein
MSEKMADPMSLRLPTALREKLDASAKKFGRSLNAEIRVRLESSFDTGFDGRMSGTMLENEVESLRSEIRGSVFNLNEEIADLRSRLAILEGKNG